MLAPKRKELEALRFSAHQGRVLKPHGKMIVAGLVALFIVAELLVLTICICHGQEMFPEITDSGIVKPGITLAWNMASNSDGSVIRGGIAPGQYPLTWDAGTNQAITIAGLPGGFTWYFVAEDYKVITPATNHQREYSLPTAGVAQTVPCPWGGCQLLVTNGAWVVACQGFGNLQSSSNLVTWTTIGPAGYGSPAYYQGPATNRQFFRIL